MCESNRDLSLWLHAYSSTSLASPATQGGVGQQGRERISQRVERDIRAGESESVRGYGVCLWEINHVKLFFEKLI